jgi:hypothetical protein
VAFALAPQDQGRAPRNTPLERDPRAVTSGFVIVRVCEAKCEGRAADVHLGLSRADLALKNRSKERDLQVGNLAWAAYLWGSLRPCFGAVPVPS